MSINIDGEWWCELLTDNEILTFPLWYRNTYFVKNWESSIGNEKNDISHNEIDIVKIIWLSNSHVHEYFLYDHRHRFRFVFVIAVATPIALDMTPVTTFVIGINCTIAVSITTISAFAFCRINCSSYHDDHHWDYRFRSSFSFHKRCVIRQWIRSSNFEFFFTCFFCSIAMSKLLWLLLLLMLPRLLLMILLILLLLWLFIFLWSPILLKIKTSLLYVSFNCFNNELLR